MGLPSRFAQRWLEKRGYKCIPPRELTDLAYRRYQYVKPDGTFDIDAYRSAQIEANKVKIDRIWAVEENIEFLAGFLKRRIGQPDFGICHGTRRGQEQAWFKKYLGDKVRVIGTEISDTATQFPDTIQWDFHETKDEWIESADFIYSNAFDHTYDPEKCLNAWMSCVRPSGVCILEHGDLSHGPGGVNRWDPFGADLAQMAHLIAIWGQGTYCVRDIIKAPVSLETETVYFLIIHKF